MAKQAFGPASQTPYSGGLLAGGLAFVSGQIGKDPKTGEIADSVGEQTRQAIANLESLLHDAGLGLEDVVKTTVFLADVSTIEEMNAVYREAFAEPRPTRSTIGVGGLPGPELKVEIEAIALRRD